MTGKLVSRYVTSPQRLGPLESRLFVVEKTDYKGGSGANFIVQRRADYSIELAVCQHLANGGSWRTKGECFPCQEIVRLYLY